MNETSKNTPIAGTQPESIGAKVKSLRFSRSMTISALARTAGITERAIRYIESEQRTPSIEVIKKLAAALEVGTDYFMDDESFREEQHKEEFLKEAGKKYGSRGKAQAQYVLNQAAALYAGGELSDEEREAFREEMEAIFWDSKEDAKKYTPKKYR